MGIEIYPQKVRAGLESLNRSLASVTENAPPLKSSIEAFIGTEDLQSEAFKSRKDYMSRGHLPAIDSQLNAVNQLIEANHTHISYIDSYLGGEGYLSEDRLMYQIDCLRAYIITAEDLQLEPIADLLRNRQQSCLRKLENLQYFDMATASLYDGAEAAFANAEAQLSALEGAVYDSAAGTYFLPLNTAHLGNLPKDKFIQQLIEQFGFDAKTARLMFEVYDKIQDVYKDSPQEERDWYFARAMSQLGDYNSMEKKVLFFTIETNAWRKGAGWAYEYDGEEKFFLDTLVLNKEDYLYLRQMIRLQHFIASDSSNYSYNALCTLKSEDSAEFAIWKGNMEKATGKTFTDDEYMEYYKELYEQMGSKGDCSHMFYTIAANLNDDKHKVDNNWINLGASALSWKNAEERKDVVGWLGDAVYTGDNNKTSFGNDDYIADLDADNIAHRTQSGGTLLNNMNEYYQGLSGGNADTLRTEEFLKNNSYEDVETAVFDRIFFYDANEDGKKTLEDLKDNETYKDTYNFLKKLKGYQKK